MAGWALRGKHQVGWLLTAAAVAATVPAMAQSGAAAGAQAAAEQKARALVAKMTLEEKVSQMQNAAAAIPRLGVPAYDWWNEGLHGVARSGYATVFPQAIGMAATWDPGLIHEIGDTISTEARAKYNQAMKEDLHSIYFGLTFWSPNINIFRDPRWGRGQETYGEDPYLTSRLGVAFVEGMQGTDPNYLKVVSTPKHFAVHSGPESERHRFNVDPSPHDLEDTYLPAFRATVTEAKADSVMCAYNAVDGAPACANKMLLQEKLRKDWGFDGYVTSDCAAITDISEGHKYAPNLTAASVDAVRAGTDTSCGKEYATLVEAVHQGMISEKEIDESVVRLFTARYRLGMLGNAGDDPYAKIGMGADDTEAHRALARKAAEEAMVLLKNDGALPLDAGKVKTIAVVGPNAESLAALEGNYNGQPSHPWTPIDAIREKFGKQARIVYAQGAGYAEGVDTPVPSSAFRTGTGADAQTGLEAEYVVDGGAPVRRVDRHIDFDWDAANPLGGTGIAKSIKVTWTGEFTPPGPGEYLLRPVLSGCYPCGDTEAYQLYLDGQLVSEGKAQGGKGRKGPGYRVNFADTKPHAFKLQYTHSSPVFAAGISLMWQPPAEALKQEAVAAAKQADVVLAFVGLSPNLEGEEMPVHVPGFSGGDRTDISLPGTQQQMLEAVAGAGAGKPLVVVLMNGSALAVNWAQQHANAILEAWYPGEEGGHAIADTLAGDNDPGGRLPVTFYAGLNELPPFEDYSMANRTYRYFHGKPLYGFGYGLSYARFRLSDLRVRAEKVKAGETVTVEAEVENTSERAGETVAELYLTGPQMAGAPLRWLAGFERVHLAAHGRQRVAFKVDPRAMSMVDEKGARAVRSGGYAVFVGQGQPADDPAGLKGEFTVEGSHDLAE